MKRTSKEQNNRFSLMVIAMGIILLTLLAIAVSVGCILVLLIQQDILQLGPVEINFGSFLLALLIWNLIVGLILSFISSSFLMKPINKIINALNRLSAGDYSTRLSFQGPFSKTPAFKEMTNGFNTMASELEQTEMLRLDFVNNFSHEFKTPIVSIAGFAKLLKRGNLSEGETAEYLDIIEEESLRLSQMATNVLNLTKVENQNILTEQQSFNLSEQLRTCILMLEGKWSRKHLELSLPMEEYYYTGNEELLKQVWINLLDNAIKFSPDYGTVEAKIVQQEDLLTVAISNLGEPIPEEEIPKIFSKFYQSDQSHSTEGNGVGLAIVKKIVDLHQGTIRVLCKDGKTNFIISLSSV